MDEKTEQLRDIFVDVTEAETVTESQEEQRGSLVGGAAVDERLVATIQKMRERLSFETELDDESLCTVVKLFYDGESDDGLATVLAVPPETVVQARMDLHLVREADAHGTDLATVRSLVAGGADVATIADQLDIDRPAAKRARRAAVAEDRAQRVSQRFRTEFEEILTDADIAVRLTAGAQDDGLEEATEDMEVDVEF
jgi:hypothetical protein